MTRKMYTGTPLRIMAKAAKEGPGSDVSGMMTRNSETTIIMTGRINHTCVNMTGVIYIYLPADLSFTQSQLLSDLEEPLLMSVSDPHD